MPKFTIVSLTYRPGGYDMLADSLAHQTCQDYELICVDERVDLHAARMQYLKDHNVKVAAISESKKRSFSDIAFGLINAYNTGVLLSRGEFIIIMNDFTWLPYDALQKFERAYERFDPRRTVISGAADYSMTERPPEILEDPVTVWERPWFGTPDANGFDRGDLWAGDPMELFYTCFPYSLLVAMNGFPECYDNHKANQVIPTYERILAAGGQVVSDEDNRCFKIHKREWGGGLWHQSQKMTRGNRELIVRENTFDLSTHERGTLPMGVGNENLEVLHMEIKLPFDINGDVLEVGCGDIPVRHDARWRTMDMRKLPTVDYVGDMEHPWPVPDASFDGVFGKFSIEHVSWRSLPHFAQECYRVLRPSGGVFMVGPNTLEQCRVIARLGTITEKESALLFGGQEERGWNEHKAALSPAYAVQLFKDAGFEHVETEPWPGEIWTGDKTDLIIRAWKTTPKEVVQKQYPVVNMDRHNWKRSKASASDKILEVGCAENPTWAGTAFHVTTLDRQINPARGILPDVQAGAHEMPFPDGDFDVVFVCELLEHMDDAAPVLKEALRVARGKVVITVPYEHLWPAELTPFQNTGHVKFYTPEMLDEDLKATGYPYRIELIRYGQWAWLGAEVFKMTTEQGTPTQTQTEQSAPGGMTNQTWYKELETKLRPQPVLPSSPKVKLNIGSFTVMFKGWINCDILDLAQWASQSGFEFRQFDARTRLPWPDGAVDLIVASHFLEHITRQEGGGFLTECYRVLKPGGVLRITVPDTRLLARAYVDAAPGIKQFTFNEGVQKAQDETEAFWNLLTAGHVTAYDKESLAEKLNAAGFVPYECGLGVRGVERAQPVDSNDPDIIAETLDMYPTISVIVEGVKPAPGYAAANVQEAIDKAPAVFPGNVSAYIKKDRLKVGLISTRFFGLPPRGYSGLEQIVWDLACGLSELGHEVTLFAPEGSQAPPGGSLVTTGAPVQTTAADWFGLEQEAYDKYKNHLTGLDMVHSHDWFGVSYAAKMDNPSLKVCHTHHGHMDPNYWMKTKPPFKLNFIAISKHMQAEYGGQGMPARFVYNGIDTARYAFKKEKGDRLLFVGRLSPVKRPHMAIEIARQLGMKLDIVGGSFVAPQEVQYMEHIKSMCDGSQIVMHADASHEEKVELMQNARCLIFPSNMGEPFGLCPAEAMSCGTGVVCSSDGAIPEVVENEVTGYVCHSQDEMLAAVKKMGVIRPEDCRTRVERLFSRRVMAENYVQRYREILGGDEW